VVEHPEQARCGLKDMHLKTLYPSILLLLVTVAVAGCSGYPKSSSLVPIEFTYIRIGQDQYSTGGLNPHYEGSLAFPYCLYNPNDYDLMAQDGYEVYQIRGPPSAPNLHLVKSGDSGRTQFRAHFGSVGTPLIHNVLLNETIEGNSTDYTIHIWHQILNPEPIHRVDRWFNMTFTPYGPSDTTYTEGEPC
jgi:hypothetical protein